MESICHIATPLGDFRALFSVQGLAGLDFPGQTHPAPPDLSAPSASELARWQQLTTQALLVLSNGKAPENLPPLDLSWGTEFQQAVWQQLLAIPLGSTRTYGELAEALGKPGGSRAVGAACGANPIPVIIPCHRVLAARGKLGGFSGGRQWKLRLLQLEGVLLA